MGDRILIQFKKGEQTSPVVYLHSHGCKINTLLDMHDKLMETRKGDLPYSAARFIGLCHEYIEGNLSLGVWGHEKLLTAEDSHGDAGCVVVDVNTFEREYFGGYFKANGKMDPYRFTPEYVERNKQLFA